MLALNPIINIMPAKSIASYMKKLILAAAIISAGFINPVLAQTTPPTTVEVSKVVNAEEEFNKVVERKGIKNGFLSVADIEGVVFRQLR